MADYQKMYYILCAAAAKAIDTPTVEANQLLQEALYEAEDLYIRTCEEGEKQNDMSATDVVGPLASARSKLLCFSSERDALRQQMDLMELRKTELLYEEKRLKTMSVEQLLEMNHVLQDSVAKQLKDLQARYASLYISSDMKRQDIYKMVDRLCLTEPLDQVYYILSQLLHRPQKET